MWRVKNHVYSLALENDVSLRSVLGLPILLKMGTDINLIKTLLLCIELNLIFSLELQPPGKGLSEGASLNHHLPTISSTFLTNLTYTNAMLHYTSAEGIPQPVCSSTSSNNILITDYFFNDTVTRELSHVPSNFSAVFT